MREYRIRYEVETANGAKDIHAVRCDADAFAFWYNEILTNDKKIVGIDRRSNKDEDFIEIRKG